MSEPEYSWIKWNSERLEGEFVSLPERDQIPENIKEQLIVELYSKKNKYGNTKFSETR